ncbi:related to tannase precursor [Cephalotrichum gorgonifer]|uniref:Carboxylic ester hydrolase n=1 Tax=Cephalotrichum gorgonifer TaxID=2041049 RepID=A0AAE8MXS3_9PEZI|nr:related to tannase precursor [Cephalotrichum gorgonifer]
MSLNQVAGVSSRSLDLCNPGQIHLPKFPDLEVLSVEAASYENYTFTPDPALGDFPTSRLGLDFCNITITYTHPGWGDNVIVTTLLPQKNAWNGRLMAHGGGGLATGAFTIMELTMLPGLVEGYAVTTTNGGHTDPPADDTSGDAPWALSSLGNVNWPLLVDFASVALHDLSTVGKAVVDAFYGVPAVRSYFYGGSTGGRQGHMLAQRYPNDFDGLLAIFPAIGWTRLLFSGIWPTFLMDKLNIYPQPCEISALTLAALSTCDVLDGVEDGIISRPDLCSFDPHDVVGNEFDCNGTTSTFTSGAATIAKAAWDGPRSSSGEFQWYGFSHDANISQAGIGAAATVCDEDGENCDALPFNLAYTWARYWLKKNPDFNMRNITHEVWDELFHSSVGEYESIIGTYDPDLSGLRKAGGKMINWHGLADQIIPVNGSVEYYDRVLTHDPNAQDYYRLFLLPGADHCVICGVRPPVMKMMEILVDWVERGKAPETLPVAGENRYGDHLERDVCMYPRVQHYVGGDMEERSSFICV